MSKRHQSSRRKTYGRRQHEVHERRGRRHGLEPIDVRIDTFGMTSRSDLFSVSGPESRIHHSRLGAVD